MFHAMRAGREFSLDALATKVDKICELEDREAFGKVVVTA